jgi:folate-binding protein YgfZ
MPELNLSIDRARLDQVRHGATVVITEPAVFRVTGAGALTCLQGLLTNDLVKPGDGSLVYGAMLTSKGMIVVDAWVMRQGDAITMIIPGIGHAAATEIFRRQLPPRLAQVTDLTGSAHAAWLLGARAFQTLAESGVGTAESAGRVVSVGGELSPVALGLGPESAPFVAVAVGLAPAVTVLTERLLAAGARVGDDTDLHAARIIAGWPALGMEIDERTLPQEVRYDELGGVSYTKGCYLGQETVARLHFRGHTNRELRGLRWRGEATPGQPAVMLGEREVGVVRSMLQLSDRVLGLGVLRREVSPGDEVSVAGSQAQVVHLPFGGEEIEG